MSIKLSYYLGKNKIDLKKFCEQMNLKSYNDITKYCSDKNINCDILQEDVFSFFIKVEKVEKVENEEKIIKKPAAKTRRRSRKSKAKTARTSTPKDDSWRLL